MREEEKKAIKKIKKIMYMFPESEEIKLLLNLLDKQQKEIEENQVLIDDIKEHRIVYIDEPEFEEKFISKDKIKNKIEQLELFKKALPIRGTEIERFIGELKELLKE